MPCGPSYIISGVLTALSRAYQTVSVYRTRRPPLFEVSKRVPNLAVQDQSPDAAPKASFRSTFYVCGGTNDENSPA